ncbi:MAG: permease-like cell division protein FtsX [Anaerovoracaceae bacterium]
MLIRFGYTLKQGFKQLLRNRAMTFASIFAITAMLLILGVFFIIIVNINTAAEGIKDDYNTIELFLEEEKVPEPAAGIDKEKTKNNAATTTIAAAETNAKVVPESAQTLMTQIETWKQVEGVSYRSKEEAIEILKERWGKNGYLLENLRKNPLPNSIIITVTSLEGSNQVAVDAAGLPGVEDVKYYKDTVDKLMKATKSLQLSAIIIMLFLIVVSVVVVSNTIKITVLARSDEINIMKYVGATNWFIRGPFLVEGMYIGILAAIISSGILVFVYSKVVAQIGQEILTVISTPLVPATFLAENLIFIFLALGISIGTWGSIISMRRFLDT